MEFLPGRMRFIAPYADDIKPNERPPFGVCLLIFEGAATRDPYDPPQMGLEI